MVKGETVIVKRPLEDNHPVGWLPEMDRFADKIFVIHEVMEWKQDPNVIIYELKGAQPYLFIKEWLKPATFRGFCDVCGGFRQHKRGCK